MNIENSTNGVVIFGIVPGSEAAIDGILQPGDEIVAANGVDLVGATRDRVAQELKKAVGSVVIEVKRPKKAQKQPRRSAGTSNVRVSRTQNHCHINYHNRQKNLLLYYSTSKFNVILDSESGYSPTPFN